MRLIFYIHHHHHQHLPCLWTWATIVLLMYGLIADTTTGVESVNLPTFYTMASNGLARSLPRQFWKSCIPIWWLSPPQMFSCIPMDDSVSTPQMFSCIPIGRLWVNTTNILVYLFYYPGSALQTLLCMPIEWSWVNTTDILVYTHWMTLGQHNHILGRIKESCHSLQCELGHCLQNLIDMSLFLASISVPAMVFL